MQNRFFKKLQSQVFSSAVWKGAEEATASLAASEKIGVDAQVAAIYSEMDVVFTL